MREFREEDSERTAVIARCGMERSEACGAEAKGTMRDDCISKKGSKVFELLDGGAATRKAGRRKLNVFAPLGTAFRGNHLSVYIIDGQEAKMPVLRNEQDLFPNGDFALLEAICPTNSADTEKATYLLRLFKIALEPEDDV